MLRVGITGAHGFLGWHARVRLRARNANAAYRGEPAPYEVTCADRTILESDAALDRFVASCDVILHFAGVNRGDAATVEEANRAAAAALVAALERTGAVPHVVFANSTHAEGDSPYGRGKAAAARLLAQWAARGSGRLSDLVLPHLFGECGRADYNMVTATLCERRARGGTAEIRSGAGVELVHAGAAVDEALAAVAAGATGTLRVDGRAVEVAALDARIREMADLYDQDIFPDLADPFDLTLFNTYRSHLAPPDWQRRLRTRSDARGRLFEAAKAHGGGQTFVSVTEPGRRRGDHFHLRKVERFVVLEGEALIRIRRVLGDTVHNYQVNGTQAPVAVDMPTLHTHSIENVGDGPLLTLFWAHEVFDPAAPDTFGEPVLEA